MNISTEFSDSGCKIINNESNEQLCEIYINDTSIPSNNVQPFRLSLSFNDGKNNVWEFNEHAFYCDVENDARYRVNMRAINKTNNIQYDFYGYAKCSEDKNTDKHNVLTKAVEIICNVLLCKDINEFDEFTEPVFVIKQQVNIGIY